MDGEIMVRLVEEVELLVMKMMKDARIYGGKMAR